MHVRTHFALLVALTAIALVAVSCGGSDDGDASHDEPITVELSEFNASGQSGTATLTATGGGLAVEVEVNPADPKRFQYANVHPGTCENLGPVYFADVGAASDDGAFATTRLKRIEDGTPVTLGEVRADEFVVLIVDEFVVLIVEQPEGGTDASVPADVEAPVIEPPEQFVGVFPLVACGEITG